jgi:hypothetical protein
MSSYVPLLTYPSFSLGGRNVANGRNCGHRRDFLRPARQALYIGPHLQLSMGTVDRVRKILSTKGLTLYRVSQHSADIFGASSPYFIPQHLYFDLGLGDLSPSIHQLLALSQISNYRLCDWMAVFGFRLGDIPRLQSRIARRRTVLLDTSVYDEDQWTPWFAESVPGSCLPAIAPLGQILKLGAPRRARQLLALNKRRFLYAKVGREDVVAFPTLAPGSIVRIDVRRKPDLFAVPGPGSNKNIFLVENGPTLSCGHLRGVGKNRIVLYSTHFPFSQLELTLGHGVRILGLVDAEIRPFLMPPAPEIAAARPTSSKASHAILADPRGGLQHLLRMSRIRVGLTFREASALSRSIAGMLADPMYFTAAGTLSDYEYLSSPPRHIQKIISLCILYCVDFWSFLRAGGLPLDSLGTDPLPDEMVGRVRSARTQTCDTVAGTEPLGRGSDGYLSTLIDQWEELPLFIKNALPALTGLKDLSLSDIFWVGGNQDPVHPCLVGAIFVAVNRRVKTPADARARSAWEQPLYILLKRDGSYLCGSCNLQQGVLLVHPHSDRPHSILRFRNGIDAEVIGQVVGIFRRLC